MTENDQPRREHLLLRPGPALLLLLTLSFIYNWYYLTAGFYADEYCFLNLLRQDPLPYSRWLGFWSIYEVTGFTSTWWFEREAMGTFFRPLPSIVFEGLVRLFGERALPLHLLSIVLHGMVGGALFLIVRRLSGRPFLGLLAGIVFLSCEDHSLSVGWIATFTDLMCVLFVCLSLLTFLRWLADRRPRALVGSLLWLVPALLSKESAVLAPLAMVLLTLLCPAGRTGEVPGLDLSAWKGRLAGFFRDWLSWVPAVALMIAYLSIYKLLGFGGMDNAMYINPFSDPGRYLSHLSLHLPVMWLATLSPVPPSLVWMLPESLPWLAGAGLLAFAVLVVGLWSLRRSGLVLWSLAFYLLALLPQMSSDASERGLYLPAIASSVFIALLIVRIGPIARRLGDWAHSSSRVTRFVGWSAFLGVLLPGVLMSGVMPFSMVPSFESISQRVSSIPPLLEGREQEHVLALNTPGAFFYFIVPEAVEHRTRRGHDIRVLSALNGVATLERVDERAFLLRTDRAGWLTSPFTGMIRLPETPRQGRVYDAGIFTATLQEMTSDGRDVEAVLFRFVRPLDDPALLFITWDGEAFRAVDVASLPIGDAVILADTSGGWGF